MSEKDYADKCRVRDARLAEVKAIMKETEGSYIGFLSAGRDVGSFFYSSRLRLDTFQRIKGKPADAKVFYMEEV